MAQSFFTKSVPVVQPALYQLSIRQPGSFFGEFATYTFPLSPSQLRSERSSLSTIYDTQGPPTSQGVTRVVDTYGLAPPIFTVEGTTGWDRHATDGLLLTGLQSMLLLEAFLANYASLNQQQRQNGVPDLYILEFYDFFTPQFWQIEPIGPQVVRQSNDKPLLAYYRFRWAAVQPAGFGAALALGAVDAVAGAFATPMQEAAVTAASTLNAVLSTYTPIGLLR